jgi:phosphohistidine phosphatase
MAVHVFRGCSLDRRRAAVNVGQMLTLTLLRHAKSSWDEPLDDFDRPLAPRGEKAAPQAGAALAAKGLRPDLVLCSGAVRARETLARVLPALGLPAPDVIYDDALYMAAPATLLSRLRGITAAFKGETPRHVLLVGHNPGLEELALLLVGAGPREDRARLATKFPTAAFATITFPVESWSEVAAGSGRLEQFITPKQLT